VREGKMDAEPYLKLEDMDILLKKIDLLEEENVTLKKSCDNFEQAYEMMKKRVEELAESVAMWTRESITLKERAEQAEASLTHKERTLQLTEERWKVCEEDLKRLKEAVKKHRQGGILPDINNALYDVLDKLDKT
jgi:chromosome segregation ATPase